MSFEPKINYPSEDVYSLEFWFAGVKRIVINLPLTKLLHAWKLSKITLDDVIEYQELNFLNEGDYHPTFLIPNIILTTEERSLCRSKLSEIIAEFNSKL